MRPKSGHISHFNGVLFLGRRFFHAHFSGKEALNMQTINFDYFYGDESEQFSYYRIPGCL